MRHIFLLMIDTDSVQRLMYEVVGK